MENPPPIKTVDRLLGLFSGIPLTLRMLVLTVIVGLSAGGLLGMILDKRLDTALNNQLRERLSIKARDDRTHFDSAMINYHQSIKLFVTQMGFFKYVTSAHFAEQGKTQPLITSEPPPWLPKKSILRFFARIEYAILLDPAGRVREVYSASLPTVAGSASLPTVAGSASSPTVVGQAGDRTIPEQLLNPTQALISSVNNQYFITTFNGVPYILAGATLNQERPGATKNQERPGATKDNDDGLPLATMIIANPIDDNFLFDIIKPVSEEAPVVLVDTSTKRLFCSNTPDVLPAGTPIDSLKDRYLMVGKSFLDYGEIDTSIQFISLISNHEVNRLKFMIISEDRRQRLFMASTLILSFMSVLLYIMRRIKKVNTRIEEFSKDVLGVDGLDPATRSALEQEGNVRNDPIISRRSDQIVMLEERFLRLFDEVRHTKDRLFEKTLELGKSEQRIRTIIDNIPMGIVTLYYDTLGDARVLSINPEAEELLGYTGSEAIGLGIETFLVDNPNIGDFYNPGEPRLFETTAKHKNGSFFPIEVAISFVDMPSDCNDRSDPCWQRISIAIIRDITRRKQNEDAIKRARENLESRVQRRTSELSIANQQLSLEIFERKKAEELLRRNYDIQRVISSVLTTALEPLPLTEQLSHILNVILSIPWLSIQSKGCIFLVGDEPEVLEMVASQGFKEGQLSKCSKLPFGKCICGKAATFKKVVFVGEINELHDIRYDNVMQHGHYCVPILSGERILGVINLYVVAGHIRDAQEEEFLQAIANTLTGIIERRLTERKLKHAQDMFFSFMKNSPMAAFIKDEDGRYIYVNEQVARFTNMKIEDIIGKTDLDLFPPERAAEVRAHDAMVLTINKTVDLVETFRQEDGIHQWLVIKFPFQDETGNQERPGALKNQERPGAVKNQERPGAPKNQERPGALKKRMLAGMSIDMTERKRIEEALKKSEEKYRNIINTTPEGFFEIDINMRITEVNDSLCHMLNMTQSELIGQQLSDAQTTPILAVTTEEDDDLLNNLVSVLRTGNSVASNVTFNKNRSVLLQDTPGSLQLLGRHDGRKFHSRINISAIKDTDGVITGAFALLADISELVEMKNSLSLYTRELKRSNEELQEFASVASHDLQEPLRKIVTFGDRLGDKYASNIPDEGRDYLSRMQGAAQRMQTLIDGLLNYARVSTRAKPFSATNLNDILKDVLSDLEARLIKSAGRVETDVLPTIDADKLQMHQLFMNLVGNGLKFHKADVPPVVSIKVIVAHPGASWSGKEPGASWSAKEPGASWSGKEDGFCEITVSDNGIGFDERHLDKLFKPFQRLVSREKYEGTGMGLAICEKIVKRHGGDIEAHSVPNIGSTFKIRLPVSHPCNRRERTDL
ncbi:MAG: PAS domain S-box protein [Nitrospirae bacterium]|nr:PAS domain S-box protein [Nitrospirota bacterium]